MDTFSSLVLLFPWSAVEVRVKQDPDYVERMRAAFRQALTRTGLNLTEFHEQVTKAGWKVSYTTLNRWYRGERAPEGRALEKLAAALGEHGKPLLEVMPSRIVDRQLETVLVRAVRLLMSGHSMVDAMEAVTGGEVSREGRASLSGRDDALRDEVRRAALTLFDRFFDQLTEEQERVIAQTVIQWAKRYGQG